MNRSKGRIAAIMLSALACSANNANTRALSTTGKVLTTLAAVLGATEIYNEVSAVVRKKQGKELNWYTGKFSLYNLLSNSKEKEWQTLKLNENQKSVIQIMFKNVANKGEEDDTIKRFMKFFSNEMLLGTNKKAQEGFEIFKKFLDGKLEGKYEYENGCLKITLGEKKFFVILTGDTRDKVKVIYDAQVMLEEK